MAADLEGCDQAATVVEAGRTGLEEVGREEKSEGMGGRGTVTVTVEEDG